MGNPERLITDLLGSGKLKALPIVRTDKRAGTLIAMDGTELAEFWANDGTWVPVGKLCDGAVRYLGSSTHAGHIEFKALYVLCDGAWHSIIGAESRLQADRSPAQAGGDAR